MSALLNVADFRRRYGARAIEVASRLRNSSTTQRATNHWTKIIRALERVSNPVPPSSRASDYAKAADLYERFTGHKAKPLTTVSVRPIPRVALLVGTVDAIEYTTIRDGEKEMYRHVFKRRDRPLFVVDPEGKGLYLVGGNYTFTEAGIVDRSDKSFDSLE